MIRKLLIQILVAVSLSLFALYRLDGFEEEALYAKVYLQKKSSPLPEDLLPILSQTFSYLGSGRQCLAFVSTDGKWVLKFINQKRFSLPKWIDSFPLPFFLREKIEKKGKKRKERILAFYKSYQIAYDRLKQDTAIHYLHLDNACVGKVLLIDPAKRKIEIDLAGSWFILQEKLDPFYPFLERADKEKWQESISSFLELVARRASMGVVDDDLNVEGNIGLKKEKAYLLDPGRLFFDEKVKQSPYFEEEMRKSVKFLRRWIEKNQKKYLPLFEEALDKHLKGHSR